MKSLLLLVAIIASLHLQNAEGCRQDCFDNGKNCGMMKSLCTRDAVKHLCPLTCEICKPCFSLRPSLSNCEVGTCRDSYSPLMCYYLKAKSYGCLIFRNQCRATCGLCRGCFLPPAKIRCTNDCANKHNACKYWEETGYCAARKGFPHVISVCPLSCGRCVLCPKSNTALPPTKEEAEAAARNSIVLTSG